MIRSKLQKKEARHKRVRAKIFGTAEVPRVSIFKSNRHIFVQFIDDQARKTILSSKIVSAGKDKTRGSKTDKALVIGQSLAKEAIEKGIKKAVFDRGGFKYHGRVKVIAEALRAGGVSF
jgi:large subunit ribosomal protein L18